MKMLKRLKRIVDMVVSLIVSVTILPFLYVLLGFIIKLDSRGPVIFRQVRTGLDGKPFVCYKFRSMQLNDRSDTSQASDNDPRITRVGKIIRKCHIDEIPQFYNVLKGDMSIIGPRPHMLAHTKIFSEMTPDYNLRHQVRPGITGLAQVNGYCGAIKTEPDIRGRLSLDLWYIKHMSPGLDTYIFVKTISSKFRHVSRRRRN